MPRYETVSVSPSLAKRWLDSNAENNRNPKVGKIPGYARDMGNGDWNEETGETIKFTSDGTLIDGQNRLHAVVISGKTIKFDIAFDVPRDAMTVIDTNASRTFADVLKIAEAPERMGSSGIVRWIVAWDRGSYMGSGGRYAPTHSEMWEIYHKEAERFDAAITRAVECYRAGLGTVGAMGTAYVLFHRINPDDAARFFSAYISGANLPPKHPALTLAKRLLRKRRNRITRQEQLALTIRAWNAFRKGETLDRMIIVKQGELTNSNFPQPI